MTDTKQYCIYCGRVIHRCKCGQPDSEIQRFMERSGHIYTPSYRETHYKRGVPPQIKKRERTTMRKYYQVWYTELVDTYGEVCANCGDTENLVIDHIVSIARGGLSEVDNLQLLCVTCNTIKGKLIIDCRS